MVPLVAKTTALIFMQNYSKDIFSKPENPEMSTIINITKVIITDFSLKAVSIVRERMGGQGMISANRIGEILTASHAGVTGEGDNKVVSNKIAKDLIKLYSSGKIPFPQA